MPLDLPPLHVVRPDWWDDAACLGLGPSKFTTSMRGKVSAEAAAICSVCLVRPACLAAGWDNDWMICAGTGARDRDVLRLRGVTPTLCAGGCRRRVVVIDEQRLCGASDCPGVQAHAPAVA